MGKSVTYSVLPPKLKTLTLEKDFQSNSVGLNEPFTHIVEKSSCVWKCKEIRTDAADFSLVQLLLQSKAVLASFSHEDRGSLVKAELVENWEDGDTFPTLEDNRASGRNGLHTGEHCKQPC